MNDEKRADERLLTFDDWQQLVPHEAAREFRTRALKHLSPAQQRAVFVEIPDEEELTARFEAARVTSPSSPHETALRSVPYALKDLFDVAGAPMLAGSTFLPEVRPARLRDGSMVRALSSAGAVLTARTHLHEFAYGFTGENPHYGNCEHPRFPGRTTGGSSSGSAAAVAAGIVPLAIGTDTGGSVRLPAAYCGLFGFRMTPHHAWIADAFPLVPSFDTSGWFTANAADMRATIGALVGLAPVSSTSAPRGVYLEMPGIDDDVAAACREAATHFGPAADAATRDDLHAAFANAPEIYSVTVSREAWHVHEKWAARFRDRYDPAVWQRLDRVHSITAAQFAEAERGVASVRDAWATFFRSFDFLVMPATPFAAPITAMAGAPANRPRILALTAPASIGGLPTLVVPVALPSGLSAGLQIIVNDTRSPALAWALKSAV